MKNIKGEKSIFIINNPEISTDDIWYTYFYIFLVISLVIYLLIKIFKISVF